MGICSKIKSFSEVAVNKYVPELAEPIFGYARKNCEIPYECKNCGRSFNDIIITNGFCACPECGSDNLNFKETEISEEIMRCPGCGVYFFSPSIKYKGTGQYLVCPKCDSTDWR